MSDHGCRADDQKASQVAVTLLRYSADLLLAACRVLSWHEADPSSELTPGPEGAGICHRRRDGRSADHADTGNSLQTPARLAATVLSRMQRSNVLI
jgi:hypothetical protein